MDFHLKITLPLNPQDAPQKHSIHPQTVYVEAVNGIAKTAEKQILLFPITR